MITLNLDSSSLVQFFDTVAGDKLNNATRVAIRRVGMHAQKAVQKGMRETLKLRAETRTWELKTIKIIRWPENNSLIMVIQVDPRAKNLLRLEEGDDNLPWFDFNGRKYKWIPNSEVFKNTIINPGNPLHPNNLGLKFHQNMQGPGHAGEWGGLNNTFAIQQPTGKHPDVPLVFQRIGSGAADAKTRRLKMLQKGLDAKSKNTVLLYRLVSRVKTPVKFKYFEPINEIVTAEFPQVFRSAVEKEMAKLK